MKSVMTPGQTFAYRVLLIIIFIPWMLWHIGKTGVTEFRSFCWYTFWSEPRILWGEWIDTFRRGEP